MLIPRRPQRGNMKVDVSLKLLTDISERLITGREKKPAVYTFSVSTRLTNFGYVWRRYQDRFRLMILKPMIILKLKLEKQLLAIDFSFFHL